MRIGTKVEAHVGESCAVEAVAVDAAVTLVPADLPPDTATAPFEGAVLQVPSRTVPGVEFAFYDSLAAAEAVWRGFEPEADGTVFQLFDLVAAWQKNVGTRANLLPAIVAVRREGRMLALFPLAIEIRRFLRCLIWLGQDRCDYLAPLLAPEFTRTIRSGTFASLWKEIVESMQASRRFRHDTIDLRKMPETVGAQPNPFLALPVDFNPNESHLAALHGDWDTFYRGKRSSATRQRDRSKRKRLAESGEVRFVTPVEASDIVRTVETLIRQKSYALESNGIANFLALPGAREFYLELATGPKTQPFVHVSRLDVGETTAAVHLGFQFRNRYYYVISSYADGELSRYGPGALLLRELLARACGLGLREFDFTIGNEAYKSEWAETESKLYDYYAATTVLGIPLALTLRMVNRLKRKIKRTPQFWSVVVRTRLLGARLRQWHLAD